MKPIVRFKNDGRIIFLLCSFFIVNITLNAQEYTVSFKSSGASSTLEKILVENITTGTSILLNGTDELVLNTTGTISGINEINTTDFSKLALYPNPAESSSTLAFDLPKSGSTTISIKDITGKVISSYDSYLQSGTYKFQMPVLMSGLYIVSVNSKDLKGYAKLLSISNGFNSSAVIKKIAIEPLNEINNSKFVPQKAPSESNKKALKFTAGNLLRFTGTSGTASTIIMDSTRISKEINFFLINCVDADNNVYAAIKIGPLYWMAKNLKTTKYNSGVALNSIYSQLDWNALTPTSESYCYFNDNSANGDIYGALYTFKAASSSITPEGWRLPTEAEFNELALYLGGLDVAGAKMKATGTKYWPTPNTHATNASGFNALASGYRSTSGFSESGKYSAYWTSTKVNASTGYNALITFDKAALKINNQNVMNDGLSIRCVYVPNDTRINVLKSIFGNEAEPKEPLISFDTLPIPKKTFLMPNDKELIFMLPLDDSPFKINNDPSVKETTDIPNIHTGTMGGVKWWRNLKKITTQLNDNGHENTIIAVWNEKVEGYSYGDGKVTLHIIGDAQSNFAHETNLLPDYFTIPNLALENSNNNNIAENALYEFNIKTGDVNRDGTPDILIGVHDMLRIYDGKTLVKIEERSFQSDHNLAADKLFFLCFEVTDIDKNGKNDIIVTTSTTSSNALPKLHVFFDGELNTTDANRHLIKEINPKGILIARAASFAVGDIDGDSEDEIVFHITMTNMTQYVSYFKYQIKDKSFTELSVLKQVDANGSRTGSILLARLKGPTASYYIVTSNSVVYINTGGDLDYVTDDHFLLGSAYNQVFGDQMVAGNFDKDISGTEEVCYIFTVYNRYYNLLAECYLNYMYLDSKDNIITKRSLTDFNTLNWGVSLNENFPVLAGVNTRHTGKILEFKHHEYMLTAPVVDAVLATAPYYPEWYTGSNAPSTTWGKSTSSGVGTEIEISRTASVIMGYEQEFNDPVTSQKVGGVEFSAKITAGFSAAFSAEKTVTKSICYQSGEEDAVVVSSTPYDAYFYTILKSDKPEQEGNEFMISFPRKPITQMLTVDSYNKYTEGQNTPVIDKTILGHTIGLPLTYPSTTAGLSNLTGDKSFIYTGKTGFTGAGNTGGVSKDIEISLEQSNSIALSVEVEAELVFSGIGPKFGAGYGFNTTNKITTTIGKSTQVGGYVPGIKADAPTDIKRFNWNLVWYNYRTANQTFSVVNYLVQGQ